MDADYMGYDGPGAIVKSNGRRRATVSEYKPVLGSPYFNVVLREDGAICSRRSFADEATATEYAQIWVMEVHS